MANGWTLERRQHASRLAADSKVRARVDDLRKKAADANEVTVERIVAELAEMRRFNRMALA